MNIKKGDKVIVIAGKNRGQQGEVTRVFPSKDLVLIDGLNTVKRRTKARRGVDAGTVVERSAPMHVSNVQLFDSGAKKGVRVGYQVEKGKKTRVSKATGKTI